jgi:hypothetical protein
MKYSQPFVFILGKDLVLYRALPRPPELGKGGGMKGSIVSESCPIISEI